MSDLEQLKELLFGAEKQALDSIAERVERREVRTADVADVLPEAIYQSHRKDRELVDSLSEPVGECLQQAFHDDPQTYGDALYPVMGPAIRKSITHALRNFAQQINTAVEHSISPRGLKWRWQASRAGVPFGEFLLQKTLQYRVEQAYLISRENGLLISHVHHESAKIKDSDAVSAMFTAIQDFVKESFSPDRTGRLESADMGEFTLWAVHGPHALLVCVIRGVPPKKLRGDLSAILERLHFRFGDAIREYKGDTSTVPDVDQDLQRCLRFEAQHEPEDGGRSPLFWVVLLGIIGLAAVAFFAYQKFLIDRQIEILSAALEAEPGIHITDIQHDDGTIVLRGLRDPLSATVIDVATRIGIDADTLDTSLQPFQSLEPAIIETRVEQMFGDGADVTFSVTDESLTVSGEASMAWRREFMAEAGQIAGIRTIDTSGLDDTTLAELRSRVVELDNRSFRFTDGTQFAEDDVDALRQHAVALAELSSDAKTAGYALNVTVIGATDAIGSTTTNLPLAERRAQAVAEVLIEAGLTTSFGQPDVPENAEDAEASASQRQARISIQLQEPESQQ